MMDKHSTIRLCQEQKKQSDAEFQEALQRIKEKLADTRTPEEEKAKLRAKLRTLHGAMESKTPAPGGAASVSSAAAMSMKPEEKKG